MGIQRLIPFTGRIGFVKKVRLGRYPYTTTRVRVMRTKLLRQDDYERMKRMGINEILRFLEDGEYRNEITSLSNEYSGMYLIEIALNQNIAKTIEKILRISISRKLKNFISLYANKWVFANLKLIVRANASGLSFDEIKHGVVPIPPTTYEYVRKLIEADSTEIASAISKISGIDSGIESLIDEGKTSEIENMLDREYYRKLYDLSKRLWVKRSHPIVRFLRYAVMLLNIKNALKLRKEGANEETLRNLMIETDENWIIEKMIKAKSTKEIIEILRRTEYRDFARENLIEDLIAFRNEMDRYILRFSLRMMYAHHLSLSPIFGYMIAKEIEIRNIKLIIHAKSLGLDEKFIDENLVI